MKTIQVIVKGRVQGVGFRNHVMMRAKHFPVTGYVYNRPDGDVEIVAQGEDKVIQQFLEAVAKPSHPWMKVASMQQEEISNPSPYQEFRVNY